MVSKHVPLTGNTKVVGSMHTRIAQFFFRIYGPLFWKLELHSDGDHKFALNANLYYIRLIDQNNGRSN